ncbi:MAG: 1-acyl-sn-glycerol-3-phosphate acyltransferase [Robiginitomaculum sp.]|nr:1-acyl-sn-glycerol-3-phosphate acyltransferase [Robiginitomaculum sp.]
MHIIEQLIAERAQKLMKRQRVWQTIRPALYKALGYEKAVAMADAVAGLSGWDAFAHVSAMLDLPPIITGLEHVPKSGKAMIICNHPTGLADGIFVYDALKEKRPDHMFLANADAVRVAPRCTDIIIPVEWVPEKRNPAKARSVLKALKTALNNERAVVIFPSGVLAKMTWRGLVDKPWNPTAVSTARKNNVPIIPLRINARNSAMYYIFALLNNELRDITLFHELFNKSGSNPELTFGPPIAPSTLPKGSAQATQAVREIVEAL